MVIERVSEYTVDPYEVATSFHNDYQEFIIKNDNEDVEDFVRYFVEEFGFQPIADELGISPEVYFDKVV